MELTKAREAKKDKEGAELEAEKARIQGLRQTAQEEYEEIKRLIAEDDEYRKDLAKMEAEKQASYDTSNYSIKLTGDLEE